MLTEIWPAYSNEIHGTWRETKSFNWLGKKDTTCHESDRSIQKKGIEFIKSTDDDGMKNTWWGGTNPKVLSYKAVTVVATKFQRHCAANLKPSFFYENCQ